MYLAIAAIGTISVLAVAFILYRFTWSRRRVQAEAPAADGDEPIVRRRSFWDTLYFMAGPLPLSVSLHVIILLALLWGVHLQAGRNLINVDLRSGGGGSSNEVKQLDMPEMPVPDAVAPLPIERPVLAPQSSQAISIASHYVRTIGGAGIGIGRGGGIGSGYGNGVGAGFGGFIGGLRKSGLDVAVVIDGTGSMKRIIGDVKDKMKQLVLAVHRLVPTARIGIVVFGGRGEPIQTQPLTVSPDKLLYFLNNIQARDGGEWQEDTLGAVRTAVDRLAWKPGARKVIVLVGDTPPFDDDMQPTLEEIRKLRSENGSFSTVDVTVEEHERFIEEFYRLMGQPPPKNSPLPSFAHQTQVAYQNMAAAGGGEWHSLSKDQHINQQVLILAFGSEWQSEVSVFAKGISTKSPASSSADP
jgi:nitrogen fixation-related uncharacterized protein